MQVNLNEKKIFCEFCTLKKHQQFKRWFQQNWKFRFTNFTRGENSVVFPKAESWNSQISWKQTLIWMLFNHQTLISRSSTKKYWLGDRYTYRWNIGHETCNVVLLFIFSLIKSLKYNNPNKKRTYLMHVIKLTKRSGNFFTLIMELQIKKGTSFKEPV